jgi:hypothetical protein
MPHHYCSKSLRLTTILRSAAVCEAPAADANKTSFVIVAKEPTACVVGPLAAHVQFEAAAAGASHTAALRFGCGFAALRTASPTFSAEHRSFRKRKLGYLGLLVLALITIQHCYPAAGVDMFPSPIYTATQAIAAVAYGDFDPLHPGNELACLMADHSVVELSLSPTGWVTTTIFIDHGNVPVWPDPTSRVSLKIGQVLSENPGRQLVLNRFQQIFAIYYAPGAGWTNQILADLSGLVGTSWDADVGACDPGQSGDQVFSLFEPVFDFSMGTVYGQRSGTWDSNFVYFAEVGMGTAIGDSNPTHPGNEIVVATEMGPTYEIQPPAAGGPGPWPIRTLWDDFENAGWVVKIGDVDPDTPGNEVVYGTRYSDSILMSHYNGTNQHELNILFTGVNTNAGINNMFDIAIGRLFPTLPGKQILGVDESGSLYLVQKTVNQWHGSILWRDKAPLYAVVAADLLPSPGDELVVAGASGVVTLLSNPAPVLDLTASAEGQVLSWTALAGVTYAVETTTNLFSNTSWENLANLVYQGSFSGRLSYTNTQPNQAAGRFFRIQSSW